jgi:hypothetical protein
MRDSNAPQIACIAGRRASSDGRASTTSGVVAAQEAARGVLSDLQGTFKKSAKSRGHLGG